jgi:hypothetical protein
MTKAIYTIHIHCQGCKQHLYTYQKEGPGTLVKCYVDRITEDTTHGDLKCPGCGQEFARLASIHNRPAHKIIQGKVFTRGHCKK